MLSLIGGRDQVVKLTPKQGEGWQSCWLGDQPYPFVDLKVDGWAEVTVTAFDCDGVRIIDWDHSSKTNYDGVVSEKCSSVTAIVNRTWLGPYVKVNNPTESTEVYMSYRRLSPPPCVLDLLSASLRRCGHGAKAHRLNPEHSHTRKQGSAFGAWLGTVGSAPAWVDNAIPQWGRRKFEERPLPFGSVFRACPGLRGFGKQGGKGTGGAARFRRCCSPVQHAWRRRKRLCVHNAPSLTAGAVV